MKVCAVLLIFIAGAAEAQAPAAPPVAPPAARSAPAAAAGQVTGTVWCRDSGRPARFAGIQLFAQQPADARTPGSAIAQMGADLSKSGMAAMTSAIMGELFKGSNLSTTAAIDGSFQLDKVPPGTYYVVAQLDGYRSPLGTLSQRQRTRPDAAALAVIAAEAQKVIVKAGQTAAIRVGLDRGAVMSGSIRYSDGSPVPGVAPELLLRTKAGGWKSLARIGAERMTTDDRGAFRFYGLSPGQYAVKAQLPTTQGLTGLDPKSLSMALADALEIYSGGALVEADVKPIEITAARSRNDVSLVFPLTGLHAISGRLIAASDHHPLNAGMIELQDPGTKSVLRTVIVGDDGTFQLHYVPTGAYVLKVTAAADMQPNPGGLPCPIGCKEIKDYPSTALAVSVQADVPGVLLQVGGRSPDGAAVSRTSPPSRP